MIIDFIKKRHVLILLFLAAVLRVAYIMTLEDRWYFFDTAHYDSAAQSIVEDGTFGPSLHYYNEYDNYCLEPVYPIFMALIYKIFGHSLLAVRLAQMILSLLQIFILYKTVQLLKKILRALLFKI